MITFQREKIATIWDEVQATWRLHWAEFAWDKQQIKLAPDRDAYLRMEQSGDFHVLTVRDAGVLVGYFQSMVRRGLHYSSVIQGYSDIFFLLPQYENRAWLVSRLITENDNLWSDLGVKRGYIITKVDHDLTPIMERHGYRFTEKVFTRLIS